MCPEKAPQNSLNLETPDPNDLWPFSQLQRTIEENINSSEHLQAARERKSSKMEYHLLMSELNRLGFACQYITVA